MNQSITLYDFNGNSDSSDWKIVDDTVMGGRSDGHFRINKEGNGVFEGKVSLENNGGFSSVRHSFASKNIKGFDLCKIRLKGDGKRYQLRFKAEESDRHSYIQYFGTSGEWETIEIALEEMYPVFRGRQLAMDNFPSVKLEEIAFLIANKKAEQFHLEIDWIVLE